MPVIYNQQTNRDKAWVTAELATGGEVATPENPLPIAAAPSTLPGDNLIVTAIEANPVPLDADTECTGASVLNDSGARILWGWVGSTAGCVVPLDTGESWTLPMANLNMIEIQSPGGSGPLDVHVVVVF